MNQQFGDLPLKKCLRIELILLRMTKNLSNRRKITVQLLADWTSGKTWGTTKCLFCSAQSEQLPFTISEHSLSI